MKRFLLPFFLLLACACSTPKAPLIGITGSRSASGASLLSTNYTEAVAKAGGIPVIVPAIATQAEAEAYETDRILAVQFRPEKLLQDNDRMLPLFAYFIDRCAAR